MPGSGDRPGVCSHGKFSGGKVERCDFSDFLLRHGFWNIPLIGIKNVLQCTASFAAPRCRNSSTDIAGVVNKIPASESLSPSTTNVYVTLYDRAIQRLASGLFGTRFATLARSPPHPGAEPQSLGSFFRLTVRFAHGYRRLQIELFSLWTTTLRIERV
jgi:hypothetical protein